MEGQTLIDGLAGWAPNSAEVLSGHPAAHPRNKSSLDQPFVASWARLVQRAGTVRRSGLAFPTRTAAERTHFDWLLVARPCCRGMALKRVCALAVRQSWQALPGPWGSNQVLVKVFPGSPPARAGLDELTGRRAGGKRQIVP